MCSDGTLLTRQFESFMLLRWSVATETISLKFLLYRSLSAFPDLVANKIVLIV